MHAMSRCKPRIAGCRMHVSREWYIQLLHQGGSSDPNCERTSQPGVQWIATEFCFASDAGCKGDACRNQVRGNVRGARRASCVMTYERLAWHVHSLGARACMAHGQQGGKPLKSVRRSSPALCLVDEGGCGLTALRAAQDPGKVSLRVSAGSEKWLLHVISKFPC